VNTALHDRREPVDSGAEVPELPDRQGELREPAERLERREREQRLAVKLAAIHPTYRTLVILRDLEGLSYEAIAEVLDMPLGSVKGRLHRARAELIELLRNNTYDWELPE